MATYDDLVGTEAPTTAAKPAAVTQNTNSINDKYADIVPENDPNAITAALEAEAYPYGKPGSAINKSDWKWFTDLPEGVKNSWSLLYGAGEKIMEWGAGIANLGLDAMATNQRIPEKVRNQYVLMKESLPDYTDWAAKTSPYLPEGFIDNSYYKTGEFLGPFAAQAPLGYAMPVAKTAMGRVAANTAFAGALGATEYVPANAPEGQRTANTVLNSLTGLLSSTALEALTGRINFANMKYRQMFDDIDLEKLDTSWMPLTAAQQADREVLNGVKLLRDSSEEAFKSAGVSAKLENIVPGTAAKELSAGVSTLDSDVAFHHSNRQLKQVQGKVDSLINTLAPQGRILSEANVGEKVADTTSEVWRSMTKQQALNWQAGLQTAIKDTEGRHVIPMDSAFNKMDVYIKNADKLNDPATAGTVRGILTGFRRELDDITGYSRVGEDLRRFPTESQLPLPANPTLGKMTIRQFSDKLVELNKNIEESSPDAAKAYRIAKRVLLDTLDDVRDDPALPTNVRKGAQSIIAMRDRYATDAKAINYTISKPLRALLLNREPVAGEKVTQIVTSLLKTPGKFGAYINALDSADPTTANLFRRNVLEKAYEHAVKVGKTSTQTLGEHPFNIPALLSKLPPEDSEAYRALFRNAPNVTKSQLSSLLTIAQNMGFMREGAGISGMEARQSAARIGGNIAVNTLDGKLPGSQIPWIGGWLSKYGSGPVVMEYLYTSEGRNALKASNEALETWRRAVRMPSSTAKDSLLAEANQKRMAALAELQNIALQRHLTGKALENVTIPKNTNAGR